MHFICLISKKWNKVSKTSEPTKTNYRKESVTWEKFLCLKRIFQKHDLYLHEEVKRKFNFLQEVLWDLMVDIMGSEISNNLNGVFL